MLQIRPNEAVQATAAAPLVFSDPGDSLLPGLVLAQSPATVPDLVPSATRFFTYGIIP